MLGTFLGGRVFGTLSLDYTKMKIRYNSVVIVINDKLTFRLHDAFP